MSQVQSEINDLRERVRRLEESARRTRRGRTNQRGAAAYLGRSREFLRQLHLRGDGPRRAADGSYSFDDLDAFAEQNAGDPTWGHFTRHLTGSVCGVALPARRKRNLILAARGGLAPSRAGNASHLSNPIGEFMYEVEATFSASVPFRQPVRVFLGRDVARKAKHNSASNRALLAADLCTGRVMIERLTPRQAQQLARASYSYAHVARGLLPLERAAIESGTLSLANVARRRNVQN
jgi:hypothetical protein